jgi:hypothetical protein
LPKRVSPQRVPESQRVPQEPDSPREGSDEMLDVILSGGDVIDGSGNEWRAI